MAKQHGVILLTGQLGGISFYEMNGKYYARRKTAHNVATDPRFTRTHLNSLDFGTASRASKLLRTALGHTVKPFCDTYMASRMTGLLRKIVATDTTHALGKRQIPNGDLSLLQGFEFNKHAAFKASPLAHTTITINRAKGLIKLSIPQAHNVTLPDAHLIIGITSVNFTKHTHAHHQHKISLTNTQTDFTLNAPINADPQATIIVTLGLQLSNNEPGVMAIVAVNRIPMSSHLSPALLRRSVMAQPLHALVVLQHTLAGPQLFFGSAAGLARIRCRPDRVCGAPRPGSGLWNATKSSSEKPTYSTAPTTQLETVHT